MRHINLTILPLLIVSVVFAQKDQAFGTRDYIRAMKHATDIMVNDVTSPVAAARYYAYISLAANEAVAQYHLHQPRPSGKSTNYSKPEIADALRSGSEPSLAVILSIYQAGAKFLPSGYLLKKNVDSLRLVAVKKNINKDRIAASEEVVDAVIKSVAAYALTDGFVKLSGMKRFTPAVGDEYWQPTAPGFMSAMEPYWFTLRPFIIDSATQFTIDPPNSYSTDTSSAFYKELMEVYRMTGNLSREQSAIAMFWDCNPFALQQVGHLEFGIKKISPGGHWIGITGIACRKAKASLSETAYVHALVSATLADAFIVCWNTKYKYNRVRPETAIKKLVDRNWAPLLQTPPFPEYSSGHSVVSTASAAILTSIFGERFSFTDDSEKEFGLPSRKFRSFNEAAEEAAISRLYGGIHYRDAIVNGRKEGAEIAEFILMQVPKMALKN